jgi:uncharacterized membrane protein YhaH (DUF805 family)
MANALLGPEETKPTLREEANAPRIGRSRFIGHGIGIAIVLGAILVGIRVLSGKAVPDPLLQVTIDRYAAVVIATLFLLALLDLGIRRRHDRGRSGVDCVVALMLLEAVAIAIIFERVPVGIPLMATGGLAALIGLYLIMMLCILPGNTGVNRYGESPRPD